MKREEYEAMIARREFTRELYDSYYANEREEDEADNKQSRKRKPRKCKTAKEG